MCGSNAQWSRPQASVSLSYKSSASGLRRSRADHGRGISGLFPADYLIALLPGYGKPTVLSFHSGACSGCGSALAAFGTWIGRTGAVQRGDIGELSSPEPPSSDKRGATIRSASTLFPEPKT